MSLRHIQLYMRSLFQSLQHLDSHKIIHRDIKPGNFLFNLRTEEFMLVDFGLAQLVRHTNEPTLSRISLLTATFCNSKANCVETLKMSQILFPILLPSNENEL